MRLLSFGKPRPLALVVLILLLLQSGLQAQMRKLYLDNDENTEVEGTSFYTPSEGYVAFNKWIGYTSDTGRTYVKKMITLTNVDYNGYGANLTFGFGIYGVKAFDKQTLIVYGDYGLVPAILYSSDGGDHFKLVYHSQFSPLQLTGGITDMMFPGNGNTGFAVDADRVLKTTDKGLTWTVTATASGSYFTEVQAIDALTVFATSNGNRGNKIFSTQNGVLWNLMTLPSLSSGKLQAAYFLTATAGWLSMEDYNSKKYIYKTTNSGASWSQVNDVDNTPFSCYRMKFTDNNTGYALSGQNTVWKTMNGGVIWEPLARDNNFVYLGYSHNRLDFYSATQFWTGGRHGFLELTNNGGGVPLPKAICRVDTFGLGNTGNVQLSNFSRKDYTYRWLLNGKEVSTTYSTTYPRDPERVKDTIQLIVSNGTAQDTATRYQQFYPSVIVSSFIPALAGQGTLVTITGSNFNNANSVRFGGVAATDVKLISATQITAKVGNGASGDVMVITTSGSSGKRAGFTFIPPPVVTAFTPQAATAGTTVTITGTEFNYLTGVSFAGVPATSYKLVSPGVIEAVVPSGGDGLVSVHSAGGTGSLAGFVALPVVNNFSPTKGTQGTIMTITGTSFTGATSVTVGGVEVLSFTVDTSTRIKALVGPGNSGAVQVTKAGGQSSLPGFTWFAAPVITSFSPLSGAIGSVVTITGTGFHPTPANNKVRFGGVLATVTGGSTTSLTVKVPAGAAFEPITVTSNNLVGYSDLSFAVTFSGGSITPASFGPVKTGFQYAYTSQQLEQVDLNNDGKVDIISTWTSEVQFYKNTSVGNSISFQGTYSQGGIEGSIVKTDLNGDGKIDIVVIGLDSVVIIKNTSPLNDLSFERFTLAQKGFSEFAQVSDLDGDGKPDIAVGRSANYMDVYRNISEDGVLAFDKPATLDKINFSRMSVEDLDGDGKPDMLVTEELNGGKRYYYPNTSQKGIISFGSLREVPAPKYLNMQRADIDGDGKLDLLSADPASIIVYRNTGGGVNSYAPPVKLDATTILFRYDLGDIDGDGRVDIVFPRTGSAMRILKNISTPGVIAFAPPMDYDPATSVGGIAVVDANNDGKPDVIADSYSGYELFVYTNQVQPEPFIESFSPVNAMAGTTITIKGINFNNVTAVAFGGVPAASFTVQSPTLITAVVGNGAAGKVTVTNNFGTGVKPGFTFGIPPMITGLNPAKAPAGSSITINGDHFSTVPGDNLVYFGGLKATVTAATANALVVTVPQSAGYQPVSVTVNNLTAWSSGMFSLTWPGATDNFTAANFSLPLKLNSIGLPLFDFDGDGKLDIFSSTAISRNTSTPGNISFASPDTILRGINVYGSTAPVDMDGDGKQDLVIANGNSANISIMRNTSVPGSYSFVKEGNYPTSYYPQATLVAISDIDGDGKPDVVTGNYSLYSANYIYSILRNESVPGSTALTPRIDYQLGPVLSLVFADVDGDARPDMIVVRQDRLTYKTVIMRNNSVPGTISFENDVEVAEVSYSWSLSLADMDGDGKTDMVLAGQAGVLEQLINQSSVGNISFRKESRTVDFSVNSMAVSDLDGDGKPDINLFGAKPYEDPKMVFFKNNSTTGNIALKTPYAYTPIKDFRSGFHADIDGDGRPDIILPVSGGNVYIRNITGDAIVKPTCAGSTLSVAAGLTGSTYQWQMNKGEGFVNLTANDQYKNVQTASLQLVNIPATSNYYEFRCLVDGTRYSLINKLDIAPSVVPSTYLMASATEICEGTPVTFTTSNNNGGDAPSFQWKRNNVSTGTNSSTYTASDLKNNDVVSVVMTSNAACPTVPTAISNLVKMQVGSKTASIAISGNTVVKKGEAASVSVAFTNGGLYPSFRWEDSTDTHNWKDVGINSGGIYYSPPVNGARLRCVFTSSSETCVPRYTTFYSNVLTFTVNAVTGIPEPATSFGIRYYPNPVTTALLIDHLDLADKWESLSITGIEGKQKQQVRTIAGRTSLTIDVSSLAKGYYIVTLHRKQGPAAYLKFMKL